MSEAGGLGGRVAAAAMRAGGGEDVGFDGFAARRTAGRWADDGSRVGDRCGGMTRASVGYDDAEPTLYGLSIGWGGAAGVCCSRRWRGAMDHQLGVLQQAVCGVTGEKSGAFYLWCAGSRRHRSINRGQPVHLPLFWQECGPQCLDNR